MNKECKNCSKARLIELDERSKPGLTALYGTPIARLSTVDVGNEGRETTIKKL
jgi:hypothetical protein